LSSLHPHNSRPRPANAAEILRQEEAATLVAGAWRTLGATEHVEALKLLTKAYKNQIKTEMTNCYKVKAISS